MNPYLLTWGHNDPMKYLLLNSEKCKKGYIAPVSLLLFAIYTRLNYISVSFKLCMYMVVTVFLSALTSCEYPSR
jgi:hypothetical protein